MFKALLSPHFKEGAELLSSNCVEIPLPDDNATSIVHLLRVLHFQNAEVPKELSPIEIFNMAVVTDKYECMDALRFVTTVWIESHLPSTAPAQLSILLESAYYFQDESLFQKVGHYLVWRSIGAINPPDPQNSILPHVYGS